MGGEAEVGEEEEEEGGGGRRRGGRETTQHHHRPVPGGTARARGTTGKCPQGADFSPCGGEMSSRPPCDVMIWLVDGIYQQEPQLPMQIAM